MEKQQLKQSIKENRAHLRRARRLLANQRKTVHALRSRLIRRRRRLKKLEPRKRIAVQWALKQVGTAEKPAFSNRGNRIDQWQRQFGMVGQPWCGAFVGSALKQVGVPITSRVVYCPSIVADAKAGRNGFKEWAAWEERELGDLVLFSFDKTNTAQHVGMYIGDGKTVEGNTSPGNSGSQDNGGGVFIRCRQKNTILGVAKPDW